MASHERPPLAHVRVLELGTGVAAPYAGRLLALLGAAVRKLEPPGGDPARTYPVDDRPLAGISPLYLHLNAGKQIAGLTADGLEAALAWADVVLDSRTRRQVAGTPLDPARLQERRPDLILASVTAWGFAADAPGAVEDELLVQAVSGVTTLTGDPGGLPLRLPGWQSQELAGAYTAAAVLALLYGGARPAPHLDIAWLPCIATGAEGSFERFLFTRIDPVPAGAHAPAVFPSGAIRCRDGFVAPGTVRQHDWDMQCLLYGMPELREDERFRTQAGRAANSRQLWDLIQPWYDAHTKREIFARSLELGLAMGMVMTAADALTDPHLRARGFLAAYDGPDGSFTAPARLCLMTGTAPSPAAPAREAPRGNSSARGEERALPLAGLRLVELTTAWAGPFVGRFLGALGAEVVRVESARALDLWRGPAKLPPGASGPYPNGEPGERPYNRSANFSALNRNKRAISLDVATPPGREALLRLVARADAVLSNFTARVLPNLGLTYAALRAAKDDIVLVTMPALGATGPYAAAAGYGTIIEAMGGFGARFGHRDEGARISQTYYPDAVAGIHATVALLAALERRRTTGAGGMVDLSQQEALWLQLGEGIVLAGCAGREPDRMGNAEPWCVPSGFFPTADGGWLALVVRTDDAFARLAALVGEPLAHVDAGAAARVRERDAIERALAAWTGARPRADLLAALRRAGIAAAPVNTYRGALHDPAMAALHAFEQVTHPESGAQTYLRLPLRLDGRPVATRRPAPCFGQHTDEVLAEAGFTAAEIAALRADGVIRDTPV
jgi:crotonobetainyl-CoA:carnitine CoA-transferase CaiB-like acyl-CoA transferase